MYRENQSKTNKSSNTEKTVACPICRRPYKIYSHKVGDQTACPKCIREAEENMKPIFPEPISPELPTSPSPWNPRPSPWKPYINPYRKPNVTRSNYGY